MPNEKAGRNATDADVYLLPYERKGTETAAPEAINDALETDSETEQPEASESVDTANAALEGEDDEDADDAGSDEDEDAEESDDDEEPEARAEPTFDIDGEKVTLDELKKRGLREADYTRKTQELAAQRRQIESEAAQYRAAREQYAGQLQSLEAALQEAMPKEPNWEALRAEDPVEFAATWAEHQRRKQELGIVQQRAERIRQEQADDWQRQHAERMTSERQRLLDAVPEWKDPAKAEEDARSLAVYAKTTYGWTPEVLETITDHNFVLLLRKAQAYDELQKTGKAKIAGKITPSPTLRPGSRVPSSSRKSQTKQVAAMSRRLANSGSVHDAAALIALTLPD